MNVEDLSKITVKDLYDTLQPDAILERFAAKKANGLSTNKEFLQIKGTKGQVENTVAASGALND